MRATGPPTVDGGSGNHPAALVNASSWKRRGPSIRRALMVFGAGLMVGTCDTPGPHAHTDASEAPQVMRGEPAPASFKFVVKDSQGVSILESDGALWRDGEAWVVSDSPRVRVGVRDGDEAYEFSRVTDVTVLTDGRIAVADAGIGQIRLFDRDGAYLNAFGALGEGPGEFNSIRSITVRGDVLTVFDDRLQRLSRFWLDGRLLDSTPLSDGTVRGGRRIDDVLAVGDRFVAIEATGFPAGAPGEISRDTIHAFDVDPIERSRRSLVAVPGTRIQHLSMRGRSVSRPSPLAPRPTWDASDEKLYIAPGEYFEVIVLGGPDGSLRRIRRKAPLTATEESDIARWRSLLLGGSPPEQRSGAGDVLETLVFPHFLPAYSVVRAGAEGDVWAGRFVSPGVEPPEEWDAYDSAGQYLGQVSTPRGLVVLEIGKNYIVGLWRDAFGVEYVQVHDLDRG